MYYGVTTTSGRVINCYKALTDVNSQLVCFTINYRLATNCEEYLSILLMSPFNFWSVGHVQHTGG
jgi:hypothetical protein